MTVCQPIKQGMIGLRHRYIAWHGDPHRRLLTCTDGSRRTAHPAPSNRRSVVEINARAGLVLTEQNKQLQNKYRRRFTTDITEYETRSEYLMKQPSFKDKTLDGTTG